MLQNRARAVMFRGSLRHEEASADPRKAGSTSRERGAGMKRPALRGVSAGRYFSIRRERGAWSVGPGTNHRLQTRFRLRQPATPAASPNGEKPGRLATLDRQRPGTSLLRQETDSTRPYPICSNAGMSRSSVPLRQTLADLLCEQWAEIRCHGCGRRRRHDVDDLLHRLAQHDWDVPLDAAARSLRCRDCGARAAQIALERPVSRQTHLRLVPKDDRHG